MPRAQIAYPQNMPTKVSLISVTELKEALDAGAKVTVIDARPPEDYSSLHIPGAIRLGWEDWCEKPKTGIKEILTSPGYWGTLQDPETNMFATRLGDAGIASDSRLVVYSDGRPSKGTDGRIAWMLAYLGAQHVSLLNGGFQAWLSKQFPTEQRASEKRSAQFRIDIQKDRRSTISELSGKLNSDEFPLLIDTRSPKEHDGELFWYQPRTGRIPNSILLPFNSIFQADGQHFVTTPDYAKLLPESLATATSVATYCEVGVRAASVALLHEIHTNQVLRVYDGSMMEWSADTRLPIERG